jgi:lysophospholipase L1-like esterase
MQKVVKPRSWPKVLAGVLLCLLPSLAFAADGDVIVNVDATKAAPFRYKIKGNETVEKSGSLPSGFSTDLWDEKSSGEVWLDEAPVEGSKTVGLANTEGQRALQMYNWKPFEVPGGRIYTLTAEYLTKGKGAGRLTLEGIKDGAFNIENTGGQWKTIRSIFEQKDAVKLTTKINITSMGLDNAVYLKTLKLVDSDAVVPTRLQIPATQIKIMPLGDSITNADGYRTPLYQKLTAAGYKVKFVGSNKSQSGPALVDSGLDAHEGHGGWLIDTLPEGLKKERGATSGIAQHIEGWLKSADPDVILMMIGTNDAAAYWDWNNVEARYDSLVKKIITQKPNAKLILATIPQSQNKGYPNENNMTKDLSAKIRNVYQKHKSAGANVSLVDMNTALDPATDLADNLHPNPQGYEKMANVWLQGINDANTTRIFLPAVRTKPIAYNDPAIKYFGRWLDKGTHMESTWDTAYFKVNFTGSTVHVNLQGEGNVIAKIDDLPEAVFDKMSGTVDLAPADLPAGNHTLRLYATKGGVKIAGLAVGAKAAVSPAKALPKLIEFVGDSITAGMGPANFSTIASDKVGAEHIRLATGAMFLADGKNKLATWMDIKTGIATQYFRTGNIYQTQEPWDFKKYTADAVVINLGQNDTGEITNEFFIQQYVTMMEKIRHNYPNATILAMRPYSGNRAAPTQAAVKTRNDAGDKKVFFIDTTGWVTRADTNDGVHPTKDGHQKIADKLAPILERILKGQAPQ